MVVYDLCLVSYQCGNEEADPATLHPTKRNDLPSETNRRDSTMLVHRLKLCAMIIFLISEALLDVLPQSESFSLSTAETPRLRLACSRERMGRS